MFNKVKEYFYFSTLILSCIIICSESMKNVTFYGDMDHVMSLEVEECVSKIPEGFYTHLTSIDTHGNCVTMYKEANCTGDFMVLPKGNHGPQRFLFGIAHHWESPNITTQTFTKVPKRTSGYRRYVLALNIEAESIGPCLDVCHPLNTDQIVSQPLELTLFDDVMFGGNNVSVSLSLHECVTLPTSMKRRMWSFSPSNRTYSTKMVPLAVACFELHKHADCMGDFTQLRKNSISREFYILGSSHEYTKDRRNSIVALSFCGFQCNKTKSGANVVPMGNLSSNHIRVYDDINFLGDYKDFDLSVRCVDVGPEWEGNIISLEPNDLCITLYEEFGCDSSSKNIHIGYPDEGYYYTKFSRNLQDIPSRVRSISICELEHYSFEESRNISDKFSTQPCNIPAQSFSVGFYFATFLITILICVGVAYVAFYFVKKRKQIHAQHISLSRHQLFYSGSNEHEDDV